ncbi:MAG: CerR family C-terminal domain-containing protein [Desulfobulbaceae bacterium]|nr:CerR family C-terminal domain-containing protein [Desulfobulbaceae bacterium]
MASPKHHRLDTRTRLLQAGGEVFAQYGYRAATVRRIAKKADANVAAVNYYFSGKEGLYLAVLEHTFATAQGKYPAAPASPGAAAAPERLRAFITAFLLRLLDEGRPAWHGRLMVREIADPSPVLDRVVEGMIRPLYEQLAGIVGELLGPGAGEEEIRLAAMSIMGQCLFYRNSRPVVSRLYQGQYDAGRIREIAEHISAFSLRALEGIGDR